MGLTCAITLIFATVLFTGKILYERLLFWSKSNAKYLWLDYLLADFCYNGPNIGLDAALNLDDQPIDVLERRRRGHEYLEKQLVDTK